MFIDLMTAICISALMLLSSVVQLNRISRQSDRITLGKSEIDNVFRGEFVRMIAAAFFFVKFFCFVIWYRCSGKGNIVENTRCVYWVRFTFDLLIWSFIAYCICLE